jgi:hypothetical protein
MLVMVMVILVLQVEVERRVHAMQDAVEEEEERGMERVREGEERVQMREGAAGAREGRTKEKLQTMRAEMDSAREDALSLQLLLEEARATVRSMERDLSKAWVMTIEQQERDEIQSEYYMAYDATTFNPSNRFTVQLLERRERRQQRKVARVLHTNDGGAYHMGEVVQLEGELEALEGQLVGMHTELQAALLRADRANGQMEGAEEELGRVRARLEMQGEGEMRRIEEREEELGEELRREWAVERGRMMEALRRGGQREEEKDRRRDEEREAVQAMQQATTEETVALREQLREEHRTGHTALAIAAPTAPSSGGGLERALGRRAAECSSLEAKVGALEAALVQARRETRVSAELARMALHGAQQEKQQLADAMGRDKGQLEEQLAKTKQELVWTLAEACQ